MNKNILYILLPLLLIVGSFIFSSCNQTKPVETEKDSSETGDREEANKGSENNGDGGKEENQGSKGGVKINTEGAAIERFKASFSGGVEGNHFSYDIEKTEGRYYLTYESIDTPSEEEMRMEVKEDLIIKLKKVCDKWNIEKWNGFHQRESDVVDGFSFYLSIDYDNKEQLLASGYHNLPEGFWDFQNELIELLNPYVEELKEAEKQKMIARGVSGELSAVLANFMKKDGDSYEITLVNSEAGSYNLSMKIKSKTGEFFEEGEYVYFSVLPLEALNFAAIKELVEKHELMKWYGWEETNKDYETNEWFQISFEFEEGTINALGTEHPENYEAFRKDFLALMAETVKNAKEKYGLEKYKE